jgi:mannosyltransferase
MGRATPEHQSYLDDLKGRVQAAGLADRIHFRDEVAIAQLADHFRALDLYIAPQRWEGFGLTPLEAMASGSPVVATRVGAFEELIKDGETGHLVDIEDVDAMVKHTDALLSDPDRLAAWGKAAREHAAANFQLQHEADAIIAVYRQLLRS